MIDYLIIFLLILLSILVIGFIMNKTMNTRKEYTGSNECVKMMVLKNITPDDKKDIKKITSQKETMKHVGKGNTWNETQINNFIKYSVKEAEIDPEERNQFYWIAKVCDLTKKSDSGKTVGIVGIHTVKYDPGYRVSIFINKKKTGKGYGKVILRDAIKKFKEYKPDEPIYADIKATNIPSIRIHEANGFTLFKKIKINGSQYRTYRKAV
jgi:L-amino acid N-acyltransferase YncA